MAENEIITREDPQMQLFSQLMEGTLKKLESDIQAMLEKHYNPIPKKLWQE